MKEIRMARWLLLVLVLLLAVGCSQGDPKNAWGLINENTLLVDVRTPEEFKQGHLDGAILIPVKEVESRIAEFGEDKDRQIVVYCKAGVRAGKAEKILAQHGYTKVFNAGGYADLMASKP